MKQFKLAQVIKEEVKKQLHESPTKYEIEEFNPPDPGDDYIEVSFKDEPVVWRGIPVKDFDAWMDMSEWKSKSVTDQLKFLQFYFDAKVKNIDALDITQGE